MNENSSDVDQTELHGQVSKQALEDGTNTNSRNNSNNHRRVPEGRVVAAGGGANEGLMRTQSHDLAAHAALQATHNMTPSSRATTTSQAMAAAVAASQQHHIQPMFLAAAGSHYLQQTRLQTQQLVQMNLSMTPAQQAAANLSFPSLLSQAGTRTFNIQQLTTNRLASPSNTMPPPPPAATAAAHPTRTQSSSKSNIYSAPAPTLDSLTNHPPAVSVYFDYDQQALTEYQCLLRKQMELFEASPNEVRGSAQGRNTPIKVGQVGIRCRHCASLPKAARNRGAVYYSKTIDGVYQVAQNMAKLHFTKKCHMIPEDTQRQLIKLQKKTNRASGGKEYWSEGIRVLGVYEDDNGVMRFGSKKSGQEKSK